VCDALEMNNIIHVLKIVIWNFKICMCNTYNNTLMMNLAVYTGKTIVQNAQRHYKIFLLEKEKAPQNHGWISITHGIIIMHKTSPGGLLKPAILARERVPIWMSTQVCELQNHNYSLLVSVSPCGEKQSSKTSERLLQVRAWCLKNCSWRLGSEHEQKVRIWLQEYLWNNCCLYFFFLFFSNPPNLWKT
jgi:hypothetical protein